MRRRERVSATMKKESREVRSKRVRERGRFVRGSDLMIHSFSLQGNSLPPNLKTAWRDGQTQTYKI